MARNEFRKSQGVVPFGVGATVDFESESLMSAGLDVWPSEKAEGAAWLKIMEATQIADGRLARRLSSDLKRRIEFFLAPTEAPELTGFQPQQQSGRAFMPFVRFPNWYFCPRCRILKRIAWNTQSSANSAELKCSNMGRRVEGKGDPCGSLKISRRPTMSPVRFVVACENGHISDFPWSKWAHQNSDKDCDGGENGSLYLYSTPSAGLAGVVVGCVKCNSNRSMAGAFQKDILHRIFPSGCPGERPWLGPKGVEECLDKIPQTIQRGASNAYFAKVVSSILIPPYSAQIQQILDRPDIWAEIESLPTVDGSVEPFLRIKAKNLGVDPDAFVQAVRERRTDSETEAEGDVVHSEVRYRYDEYKAYGGPRPPKLERHDFDIEEVSLSRYPDWFGRLFERVVLIKKLRETRVLTGFSRLVPPEALDGPPASLSLRPKRWLPGFSVRGEGIFLQFHRPALARWAARGDVEQRAAILQERLNKVRIQRNLDPRGISADLIMIHTFSHLLIRQLAFECGYDSSSIRERIYSSSNSDTPMSGLLLYTASGDAEGTLGGLVRQGEPDYLDNTVKQALVNAAICSSDPLCIESLGQGTFSLNLAACHTCGLLPETSCEEGNLLLDRVLAIGMPSNFDIGYFGAALASQ